MRQMLTLLFVCLFMGVCFLMPALAQYENGTSTGSVADLLAELGWGQYAVAIGFLLKLLADGLNTVVDTGEGNGGKTKWWQVLIRWLSLSVGPKGKNSRGANKGA